MIDAEHLKVEVWPPRERGGQHVGITSSGVKITHLPTDTVAISMLSRSQHKNKMVAMDMILTALTHPQGR
jgi:protein subunit release factor A